jgi:transglutaminase-like putative cysteine protease
MGKDSSIKLRPGKMRIGGASGNAERFSALIWYALFFAASFSLIFWMTSMLALNMDGGLLAWLLVLLDLWMILLFRKGKAGKILAPVSLAAAAGLLFWQREAVSRGLIFLINLYSRYIQEHYQQGPGFLPLEEGPVSLLPALVFLSAVLLFFLGHSILRKRRSGTLLFLMAVLLCTGLTVNRFPHPLPLAGAMVTWLALRAMNGRRSGEAGQAMQARAGGLFLALAVLAAAASFFILGPVLADRLLPLHPQVQEFQRGLEAGISEAVEEATSGQWSFSGNWSGAVESGRLTNSAARRDQKEALTLTTDRAPAETVYLKGFTGGLYQGSYWQEISDEEFHAAVDEWEKHIWGMSIAEENVKSALQESPFMWRNAGEGGPADFRLELKEVNGEYAYLPYFSMVTGEARPALEADVEALRGEETVYEGQFFPESLDVMLSPYLYSSYYPDLGIPEKNYEEYIRQQYLYVPAEGLDRLKAYMESELQRLTGENGAYPTLLQVTELIRESLSGHRYSLELEPLPAEADFVEYFFFDQKEGFCTHFASTAVLMYRLAGYPARYVTGYAAQASAFRQDGNGSWTASVKGADAHAWAEVYVEGPGWIPVEMTPGFSGEENGEGTVSGNPSVTPYAGGTTPAPEQEETGREEELGGTEGPSSVYLEKRTEPAAVVLLSVAVVLTALFLFFLFRYIRITEGRRRRFRQKDPGKTVEAVLLETERMLREGGFRYAENLSDESYAEEVQRQFPELEAGAVARLVSLGEKAMFSGLPVSGEEADWCVRLYRRLEQEIGRKQRGMKKQIWRFIAGHPAGGRTEKRERRAK